MLQLVAGTAVAGLAGCSSSGGQPGGGTETEHHDEETESGHSEETEHHDEETESSHSEETEHHDEETESGHSEETESGHGHEEGGHGEIGDPTDHAEVKMKTEDGEYHFAPHVVRVTVGGTVTFHNESGSHATAAYHPDNDKPQLVPDGAAAWNSGLLTEQGATFEHTFETEGVYHYYCKPHETLGMIGTVIVGEPDAHGQPAMEEPPADLGEEPRHKIADLNERVNEALGHTH
ncbi:MULTISPECIES: plastocyanin/azurin family copper-binding protein [Haloarcula]|uniref:plastocyanin/azurin family copper-binding protein n=1 Tax=Haloarcula TaxID=2237 RepID=UPI0023EC7E0B|nr:plastocyanin/azurin family copper-binding protein [Halomicroarcula sp. XH51]